jgi:hypothetical protein
VKLLSLTSISGLSGPSSSHFCLAPGESFSQTATQYSRVVAQAERIAYLAAQRSALANPRSRRLRLPLPPVPSPIRLVAGPVGMGRARCRRGIGPGPDVLFATDLAAIKTAASTPGGWQVESTNAGTQTFPGLGTNTPANAAYPNATIQFSATNVPLCAVDTEYQHDWVVGPFQSVSTAVFFTGNFFVNGPAVGGQSLYVCHRKGIPGSPAPLQDALIPPTPAASGQLSDGTARQ